MGLANVLVYMVTSQCEDTITFLNGCSFWSSSLNECVDKFDHVVQQNAHFFTSAYYNPPHAQLMKANTNQNKKKSGFLALTRREQAAKGYIHVDCPRIWGQSSNHLAIFSGVPTRNDLVKRFTPLFSNDFQRIWAKILGPLFQKDPATFNGDIPSWNSMFTCICKLQVSGLGTMNHPSLTGFQMANNLVFAGLCLPPLLDDITDWVWKMKNVGAYHGLQMLGFDVSSFEKTHRSINCVFSHFNDNLSDNDRISMGFHLNYGPLFVEHILCKVSRWQSRLVSNCGKAANLIKLGDISAGVEKDGTKWIQSANFEDASLFPIPLSISQDYLMNILVNGEFFI
jgi:hypothetical protein